MPIVPWAFLAQSIISGLLYPGRSRRAPSPNQLCRRSGHQESRDGQGIKCGPVHGPVWNKLTALQDPLAHGGGQGTLSCWSQLTIPMYTGWTLRIWAGRVRYHKILFCVYVDPSLCGLAWAFLRKTCGTKHQIYVEDTTHFILFITSKSGDDVWRLSGYDQV